MMMARPARRNHQGGKNPEERGLAAAVRTEQAEQLRRTHVERNAVQSGAVLVAMHQILDGNDGADGRQSLLPERHRRMAETFDAKAVPGINPLPVYDDWIVRLRYPITTVKSVDDDIASKSDAQAPKHPVAPGARALRRRPGRAARLESPESPWSRAAALRRRHAPPSRRPWAVPVAAASLPQATRVRNAVKPRQSCVIRSESITIAGRRTASIFE